LAEETESALDALIDVENEGMAALAKEAGAHDPGDSFPQSSGAQLTDVLSKKIEATIARLVEERLSGIVERSLADKKFGGRVCLIKRGISDHVHTVVQVSMETRGYGLGSPQPPMVTLPLFVLAVLRDQ
jgi:hypothetical protein